MPTPIERALDSLINAARIESISGTQQLIEERRKALGLFRNLAEEWQNAYAAFQGAFDTPLARRRDNNEYAADARQRLRTLNDTFAALTAVSECTPAEGAAATASELSPAQQQHLSKVPEHLRVEMAKHLAAGAQVIVRNQTDVPEVGPWAIEIQGTDFWVDCCDSEEGAREQAQLLGLRLVG